MKKEIKIVSAITIGCIAAIYAIMLVSILPLIRDAKAAFLNESPSDELFCLERYDTSSYGIDVQRTASIFPLFTLHDFTHGYVYVCYSNEIKNEDGTLISGSFNVISKWEIKRIDNVWRVINITENP